MGGSFNLCKAIHPRKWSCAPAVAQHVPSVTSLGVISAISVAILCARLASPWELRRYSAMYATKKGNTL